MTIELPADTSATPRRGLVRGISDGIADGISDGISDAVVDDWATMLAAVLSGHGLATAYQPIVDVRRGTVVGYEALARFVDFPETSPELWFAAAARLGLGPELQAAALRNALRSRPGMPRNCFLTLNVGPDVLCTDVVRAVFAEAGSLAGIVVELTEHAPVDDYRRLEPDLNRLRAAGALLAVDDAGSGYAGLTHLLALRPSMIKLDRELIRDIDRDEAKRALVEMVGTFAGRVDAWVLAEGVEREAELLTLATLGVPLAQGYFLGRPQRPWAPITQAAERCLMADFGARDAGGLRSLLEFPPVFTDIGMALGAFCDAAVTVVVLQDRDQRPLTALTERTAPVPIITAGMKVNVDSDPADVALRALTRAGAEWSEPVLCTDNAGRYVGIVRVERLVHELASRAGSQVPEDAAGR